MLAEIQLRHEKLELSLECVCSHQSFVSPQDYLPV